MERVPSMIDNLGKGLSPILYLTRFCGLVVFECPTGCLRPFLSAIYILIQWGFYGILSFYLSIIFPNYFDMQEIWQWLKMISISIAIFSAFSGIYFCKDLQNCLISLQVIDDSLEKFGARKEYWRLFKYSCAVIISWMALYFAVLLRYVMADVVNNQSALAVLLECVYLYPRLVNTASEMLFWILLWYTGTRFNQINKCIEKLGCERNYDKKWWRDISFVPSVCRNSANTEKCKRTIRILMQMHLQLCKLSQVINNMFGAQVCLETGCHFFVVIMSLIQIFEILVLLKRGESRKLVRLILLLMWYSMHIAKLFCTNCVCENVRNKANKSMELINKLLNTLSDEEVRLDGKQFTFQILQKPLKFTGLGLFPLGYDFIKKYFTFKTTVLILLLQINPFPYAGNVEKDRSLNETNT